MNKFDFDGACVSFNSDPYIAETKEEIKECEDFINADGVEIEPFTIEDDEYWDICERLGMDTVTMEVRRVYKAHKYNEEPMYFCLDSDWNYTL